MGNSILHRLILFNHPCLITGTNEIMTRKTHSYPFPSTQPGRKYKRLEPLSDLICDDPKKKPTPGKMAKRPSSAHANSAALTQITPSTITALSVRLNPAPPFPFFLSLSPSLPHPILSTNASPPPFPDRVLLRVPVEPRYANVVRYKPHNG